MHLVRYEAQQSFIPAKARVNLEKAVLVSMMMSLNATVKGLKEQAEKVAQAKVELYRAKIKAHLRFYSSLNDIQRLQLGYIKLRKWKWHKQLKKKARRMLRKYHRLVRKKSWVYVRKMKRADQLKFGKQPSDESPRMDWDSLGRGSENAPEDKGKDEVTPDLMAKPPTAKDEDAPKKDAPKTEEAAPKAPAKEAPKAPEKKAPEKKAPVKQAPAKPAKR